MKHLIKKIISPLYICAIFIISLLFFTFILWFPQHKIFAFLLHTDQLHGWEKAYRILDELWFALTAESLSMLIMTILLAIFTGINVTLLIMYMRRQTKMRLVGGSSLIGVFVGLLGVGCASCGAVLLTTVLGIGVATSVLSFLPLHGVEFGIIAILLLMFSIYRTVQKIVSPEVCGVRK